MMKTRRIIFILLSVVLILCLFTACNITELEQQPTEVPEDEFINCPAPINKLLRDQLDADFSKMDNEYVPDWYDTETLSGHCRIYGTDNGYTIFYYDGFPRLFGGGPLVVGDIAFGAGDTPHIYAYKEGLFVELTEAYGQGLVSREAVVKAQSYHNQCLELTSREHMIANCHPGALSRYTQLGIEQAWKNLGNETFGTWYTAENTDADWRFYSAGPYNTGSGVVMYFGGKQEQSFTTVQLGDATFSHPTGFQIYYYNGNGFLVDLISEDDISIYSEMLANAEEQHIKCNNTVFGKGWDQ